MLRHLKIPALLAAFIWSFRAMAQQPTPGGDPGAALAPLVMDPTSALMVSLLDSGGLPLVCGFIAWKLSGALNGWTPTIRVVHVREPEPWDGVDRRRGDSDR